MHTLDIFDNTILTNKQIYKIMERYGGIESKSFRREYLCELIADADLLVVPEFDKEEHVYEPEDLWEGEKDHNGNLPEYVRSHFFGDVGGVDHTGLIRAVFNPASGNILVLGEEDLKNPDVTTIGQTITSMIDLNKRPHSGMEAIEWSGGIDCEPVTLNELRKRYALNLRKPSKTTKAKEDRVRLLRTLIQEGRIKISSNCAKLVVQLEMGQWKESQSDNKDFERTAEFGHLDLLDALAYMCKLVNFRWVPGGTDKSDLNLTGRTKGRRKIR